MARWTEESRNVAIEMINLGYKDEEISVAVGMSTSSVSLLRYGNVFQYDERIECQLCNKRYKQITQKHLRLKHNIDLNEYKKMFPNSRFMTNYRKNKYKTFKHPNKGKRYSEIYGEKEAKIKRSKISNSQIGRPSSVFAGTGITGTRRDTKTYARSTYEANIDRIFILKGKKYIDELSSANRRFELIDKGGTKLTYQPDRIDVDGLFKKGAYLEIKGYMYPEDWEKIQLFRKQYLKEKLLVICPDTKYCDINYKELEEKYKSFISLWEEGKKNYKTRPDLYKIGYKTPEHIKYLEQNYPDHISLNIVDKHQLFIAGKCLAFNRVRMGKNPYIDLVELKAITDRRPSSSRKSSGVYNFELWEVRTLNSGVFYVSNQSKTVVFYCYEKTKYDKLRSFFVDNCDMHLSCGVKF